MKKKLAILMALAMVAGCCACGGKSDSDSQQEQQETQGDDSQQEQQKTQGDDSQQEQQKIVAWVVPGGALLDNIKAFAEEYNAEGHGYTVSVEQIPQDAFDDKITAARASGTAPDLVTLSYNTLGSSVKNAYVKALDGVVSDEVLSDIIPAYKDFVSINGVCYGVPIYTEPSMLMYYRKDILEEAGYSEVPNTWDEFIEVCKAVTPDGMFGLGIPPYDDTFAWSTWGMQYGFNGGRPINDNWDAPTITDGYKDMLELFKTLYDENVVPAEALGTTYTDISPIANGQLVFQINGSWAIETLINEYPEMWENIDIVSLPTVDGSDMTTASNGGWYWAVDGKLENTDGVADFLNWMYDKEHPERMGQFIVDGQFCRAATSSSIAAWLETQATDASYVSTINKVAGLGVAEPIYSWDISLAVKSMVESYSLGYETDIDKVMDECREEIQTIIDDQGLAGTNPANQ